MWLIFRDHSRKMYAQTPAGEYAYSDSQGLYEWRDRERIDYSGGDRQASDRGGFWTSSGTPANARAYRMGIAAAMSRARLN